MPKSFGGVIHEFKHGQLHSGSSSGPVVTNPLQAKAIAASEQREYREAPIKAKKKGHKHGSR